MPFDMHCYSLDWHPSDHVSFIDNIHLRELHPDSKVQDHTKAELYQTVVFSGPPKTEQVKIGTYLTLQIQSQIRRFYWVDKAIILLTYFKHNNQYK